MLSVNLRAHLWTVKSFLKLMRPGSAVVLATSIWGPIKRSPGALAYTVSKAAAAALVETLAAELLDRGVRVNGVAPGAMSRGGGGREAGGARRAAGIRRRRRAVVAYRRGKVGDRCADTGRRGEAANYAVEQERRPTTPSRRRRFYRQRQAGWTRPAPPAYPPFPSKGGGPWGLGPGAAKRRGL